MECDLNKMQCQLLCVAVALTLLGQAPIRAGTPAHWVTTLVGYNGAAEIGSLPGNQEGWDGQAPDGQPPDWYFPDRGVSLLLYRQHGSQWGARWDCTLRITSPQSRLAGARLGGISTSGLTITPPIRPTRSRCETCTNMAWVMTRPQDTEDIW